MKPYISTAEPAGSAPALARIVPFAVYLFFIFVADVLSRMGYSAEETRWLYAVKIAAVMAALYAVPAVEPGKLGKFRLSVGDDTARV